MNNISIDPTLARKLDQGMKAGETIELPFPVIYIWALNGQASYKQQGGATYYGGWAGKAEDMNAVAEQTGLAVPADWKQVTISSRDGGEFDAYTCRNAIVAPIGKRVSWLIEGRRSSSYMEGARRHLQVLAYMAEAKTENGSRTFVPWGPVVLTAKGYQARNLLDAFARWDKATSQIRRHVAPGVPAWCFYLSLGTFGKERQVVNVGKPGAQSPITPITCYIPDKLTDELFSTLFVGEQVAEEMARIQDQAAEWLKAWDTPVAAEVIEEYQGPVFPAEEEIPF